MAGTPIEEVSAEEKTHKLFLRTVIMLVLIVTNINIANVLRMKGIHVVSESTLYVLFGLVVGIIFVATSVVTHSESDDATSLQLSTNFFSMVLLPPIIFEGGFTLQRLTFVRNLFPILGLALFGGMYSTIVTSLLVFLFSRWLYPSLTFLHALTFGSIISSTDPVSVLSMLPPTVDRNLYMMIFGESALNDAVSIILYRFFTHLATGGDGSGNVTVGQFFESAAESLWIFVGSSGVGVGIALMFAKLTKHVKPPETPIFELSMLLVFAYSSYLIADLLGFTGIISIFFCGVAMAHYAYSNLSKVTLLATKIVLRTICSMCEAFIFIYIGLGLVAFGKEQTTYNVGMIVCSVFAILVSRTHVFIITWFHNLYNTVNNSVHKKIPVQHAVFLWFCGLRGAVAFALTVQVLAIDAFPKDIRALLFGTTIMVVFITVVGLGGLTPFVMRRLGLDKPETDDPPQASVEFEHKSVSSGAPPGSGTLRTSSMGSGAIAEPHHPRPPHGPTKGPKFQHTSLTTLDEYLPTEKEVTAAEVADFADTVNSGMMIKLYEWDRRYVQPFFSSGMRKSKRRGDGVYETLGEGLAGASSLDPDGRSQSVNGSRNPGHFTLGDSDSDLDFDNVPIAVASEMVGLGMAGSKYGLSHQTLPQVVASLRQEASHANNSGNGAGAGGGSRTGSVTSLSVHGGGMSKRNSFELQPQLSPTHARPPPHSLPKPPRTDALLGITGDSSEAAVTTSSSGTSNL